jgi:two-component system chemotaxis response regulator CheB
MLRVLIAEDSQVVQRTLRALLEGEADIQVVGTASTGAQALELCRTLRPDVVTMDIFMPEMDGLEATRRIMAECPARIVIISSMVGEQDQHTTFEAIRAGAIEVIEKPHGVLRGNYAAVKANLTRVLHRVAEARPVDRGTAPREPATAGPPPPLAESPRPIGPSRPQQEIPPRFVPELICIGGSTGAPAVLAEVLGAVPAGYPIPIVVVQHIARGFARGLANWLDTIIPLRVQVAEDGDLLVPGRVLVAPDDRHLEIAGADRVQLRRADRTGEHVPSVNRLFHSAAASFGTRAFGAVLSGMGEDGARGLLEMREAGAVTVAQAEETCIVWGMPKVAMERGAAMKELTPGQLAELLVRFGNAPI